MLRPFNASVDFKRAADLAAVARRAKEEQAAAIRDRIQKTHWTSDQDIKIPAQHFKGVRAPKVQAIADALVARGRAAQ